MKLKLNDLVVCLLVLLGILGSINWMPIPYYVYVIVLVAYAGLRLSSFNNKEF